VAMGSPVPSPIGHNCGRARKVRWVEMRCVRCARLLQKVEQHALRPGKRLEIKCGHCKVMNYLVGEPDERSEDTEPRIARR
jgi:phage FluMu protein Com